MDKNRILFLIIITYTAKAIQLQCVIRDQISLKINSIVLVKYNIQLKIHIQHTLIDVEFILTR